MTDQEKQIKFEEICKGVRNCQACPLYQGTTNGVPGEGSLNAKIFFCGEGPGFNEDQQGRPFVGVAGKLLTESIQSLGWQRKDVFITNVVRHRPPGNRDPLPEEIAACDTWTDQLLELIDPKIVVTLGRFSMVKFVPGVTISQTHGQPRLSNYKGKQYLVYPMYHPAAALRSGDMMVKFKEDFKKLPQIINMSLDDLIPPLVPKDQVKGKVEEEPSDQMSLL